MDTVSKIVSLMARSKCDNLTLATALKLNRQVITDWKAGRSKSYRKYLPQIAEFFKVPLDYLANEDSELTPVKPATATASTVSELGEDYVVFHRNGKSKIIKLNSEQLKMFNFWVSSAQDTED